MTAFRACPAALTLTDAKTNVFIEANDAALRLIGLEYQEVLGKTSAELGLWVDPEDRVRLGALLTSDGASHEVEVRMKGRDAVMRDVVFSAVIVPWSGRSAVLSSLNDVTMTNEAHRTLEQQTRLASLAHDVEFALLQTNDLRSCLQRCAEALVVHLDGAFARIWTLNDEEQVLELQASAGIYTHLDGGHSRVPVGHFKIGLIAAERAPHLTNDVLNDDRISDEEWARKEGMVAFAGYPLIVEDRMLGVMAMFARHTLPDFVLEAMGSIANEVALGIEMKRASDALLDSEERYRNLVETARDLVTTITLDGTITSLNAAVETTYGWTSGELIGRNFAVLVHPDDLPLAAEAIAAVSKGESPPVFEVRIRHKDGRYLSTEFAGTPITKDGQVVASLGIARDITERRLAEGALDDSRRQMEAFLQNSPTVIWMTDEDDRVVLGNRFLEKLTSRRLPDILGKTAVELFGDEIGGEMVATNRRIMNEKYPVETENTIATGAGDRIYHSIRFPVFGGDATVRGVGGISTDITDRVAAVAEKEQLQGQLHRAQRLETVGQLAGGIAHDFNNILAVILNYSDFVQQALPEGSPAKSDIAEIRIAAERAADLVQKLLIFGRREVVQMAPVEINALVRATLEILKRTLGANIDVRVRLADEQLNVVASDRQLEQVILNLAVNARDAMPGGGLIVIETSLLELDESYADRHSDLQPGEYACLAVSDTGGGMSKETVERAFEPFFTTKPKGSGIGLGLATVYGIIQGSGGHIGLYSEIGRGTTVKVYLPNAPSENTSVALKVRRQSVTGKGETVLVVEDEQAVRESTCRILGESGYRVVSAESAEAAEGICTTHDGTIDLLLTDVVMPGMSGMELSRLLSEIRPGMKRIYMSGYAEELVTRQGSVDGDLLLKPFSRAKLLEAIHAALDTTEAAN